MTQALHLEADDLPVLGEPLAVEVANTLYEGEGETFDILGCGAHASLWWSEVSEELPLAGAFGGSDLGDLRLLRDAVAELLRAAHEGSPPSREALEALQSASDAARSRAVLHWDTDSPPHAEVRLGGTPFGVFQAEIALSTIELLTGDDRTRLRRCAGPGCSLWFVQRHRHRRFCHPSCSQRGRQQRYVRRLEGASARGDGA